MQNRSKPPTIFIKFLSNYNKYKCLKRIENRKFEKINNLKKRLILEK